MDADDKKLKQEATKRAAVLASEHFDSVLVLASYVDSNGVSHMFSTGRGNVYARKGMAQQFLDDDFAEEIAKQIEDALEP